MNGSGRSVNSIRLGAVLALALLLAACAGVVPRTADRAPPPRAAEPPAARPIPATPGATLPPPSPSADTTNARGLGIVPGAAVASLALEPAKTRLALQAFRISCPSLVRRTDQS